MEKIYIFYLYITPGNIFENPCITFVYMDRLDGTRYRKMAWAQMTVNFI